MMYFDLLLVIMFVIAAFGKLPILGVIAGAAGAVFYLGKAAKVW
jgi:hypothetical protein